MPPNRVHRATPGPNMPPENWSPYLSEDRGFAPYPRGAPLTPREAFLLREVDRAYATIRSQVIHPAYLGSITGNEPGSGFAYPAGPVFAPSWTPEAPRSQEVISFVEGLDYSVPRFGIEERSPVSNFGRSATALFGPSFAGFEGVRPATAEVEDRGTDYRVRFEVPGVSKELLRLRIGEHSVELRSEESQPRAHRGTSGYGVGAAARPLRAIPSAPRESTQRQEPGPLRGRHPGGRDPQGAPRA